MLFDQQQVFSDAQALTATANSTNVWDALGARNLGGGDPLKVLLNLSAVTGTPTLTAALVGADDVGFSTNKITICSVTPTLTAAQAAINAHLAIPSHTPKRYFRMEYTVGGGSPVVTVTAGLLRDEQSNPAPPIT